MNRSHRIWLSQPSPLPKGWKGLQNFYECTAHFRSIKKNSIYYPRIYLIIVDIASKSKQYIQYSFENTAHPKEKMNFLRKIAYYEAYYINKGEKVNSLHFDC